MSGEGLSKDDVERLLDMMTTAPPPASAPTLESDADNEEEYVVASVDESRMKAQQTMHERLSRKFAARVCALLQTPVKVILTSTSGALPQPNFF